MNKRPLLTLFTFFVIILVSVYVQAQDAHDEEGDHHHHKNELSIAAGIVPLVAEDKLTVGFHLHYIRGIGEAHRIGIGVGLETILDEHKHYTISAVLHYRLYKGLIVSAAPGLLILKQNSTNEYQFAQHIELAYEFEVGEFHIGPVVELGLEKAGVHYMGGIHLGIDF
ncbi:MAG: hypothetical protein IIA45_15280 [Bacteroidetes bacterium]|nr:hypothetical protein [Bacteroidota bacterium]